MRIFIIVVENKSTIMVFLSVICLGGVSEIVRNFALAKKRRYETDDDRNSNPVADVLFFRE